MAQRNYRSQKVRSFLLHEEFAGQSPLIAYGLDTLSKYEFVKLKDKTIEIVVLKGEEAHEMYGKWGEDGVIQVWTESVMDSLRNNNEYEGHIKNTALKNQLEKVAILHIGFPNTEPVYTIDGTDVSRKEFLAFDDEVDNIFVLTSKNPLLKSYRKDAPDGLIEITSKKYKDEYEMRMQNAISRINKSMQSVGN